MLEAFAFGRGSSDDGAAGFGVDFERRFSKKVSAFAQGEIGYHYGKESGIGANALAGLRMRW